MIGFRGISWIKPLSSWESMQAWREKHRAMSQAYLSDSSTISSALATASANFWSGSATLAAQAATKRIQAEAKAKLNELSKINVSV